MWGENQAFRPLYIFFVGFVKYAYRTLDYVFIYKEKNRFFINPFYLRIINEGPKTELETSLKSMKKGK